MRITRLTPLLGGLVLTSALGAGLLTPATAVADDNTTLADSQVSGDLCDQHAPTFDDVVSAAASAIRTVVPAGRLAAYDQQVAQTRQAMAQLPVHRDLLPVNPGTVDERVGQLDDPVVTQVVDDLDAIRTGRLDDTTPLSTLTVNDVIEVFILSVRIVKMPAQFLAGQIPGLGFVLNLAISGIYSGIKWLARKVQDAISASCALPSAYPTLQLDSSDFPVQHIAVPQALTDLAHQLVPADGSCTPVSGLKLSTVVDRARAFVASANLPVDKVQAATTAANLQAFLAADRVSTAMQMQRPENLDPITAFFAYGPLTFVSNLGFEIGGDTIGDTTPLGDVTVENAYSLATLLLDTVSLLTAAVGGMIPAAAEVIFNRLATTEDYGLLPYAYGAGPLLGVMQSMCAV